MSKFVTFGFGATAALVLTLGFGGAPPAQGGSYVTLGYGQTASQVAMLGLSPPAPAGQGGSYITFGQGQTASKFAMLGLSPGGTIPPEPPGIGGGGSFHRPARISVAESERRKLLREDELWLFIVAASASLGILDE